MNKRVNNQLRLDVVIGFALVATFCGTGLANAAGGSHMPSEKCTEDKPDMCVVFGINDIKGVTHDRFKNSSRTAKILSVAEPSVWDTTAPVTLGKIETTTKCVLSRPPMIHPNDQLSVMEDGGQYLYLFDAFVDAGGKLFSGKLERRLDPAWRTDGDNNNYVAWLEAEKGNGTDDDLYDYFVEFQQSENPKDSKKYYRVEAFPHLDSTAPPSAALCDCERPDVMYPATPSDTRPCKNGKAGLGQSSTGSGNEPGH